MATRAADRGRAEDGGSPPRACCPRCAYDLRGHVETWTGHCPMRGACPECGYGFDWADVLSPTRQRLTWLYEHATRWWDVPRAWGTLLRALVFWRFWKKVRPHHEVRLRRLALWPVMILGTLIALFAAVAIPVNATIWHAWFGATSWMPSMSALGDAAEYFASIVLHVQWTPNPYGYTDHQAPSSLLSGGAFAFLTWLVLACCPSEWRGGRVRIVHVHRIGVYLLAPIALMMAAHYVLLAWEALAGLHYALARRPSHAMHGWYPAIQQPPYQVCDAFRQINEAPFALGILAWQWLFLRFALRDGLSLAHSGRVAMVAGGVGALGACSAGAGMWFRHVF